MVSGIEALIIINLILLGIPSGTPYSWWWFIPLFVIDVFVAGITK